ncbi:MAG: nucleoside recognition domain-containing protein [Ignavibacteriales bacterium]|nr:nucleoside recognition domain-containing protein [Ignavibacteriales bacterium]
MLNYVWLGLIVLGFATALYVDVSDLVSNKYQNNKELSCIVHFNDQSNYKREALIKITSSDFSKFYSYNISNDLFVNVKITSTLSKDSYSISIPSDKKLPKIWQEIASSSGKDNVIYGRLLIKNKIDESTSNAAIILSGIEFLSLKKITNESIKIAGVAVEIALGLIGIMAMWLGIMKVAEQAGLINKIALLIKPITKRLFPEVPSDHPAIGSMVMNISANMLGLGNAATPFGLKAMEELDSLNPNKGTATNSMITFLAINTAGLTLIPATAIAVRSASGSSNPTIIIGTTMFAAFCATMAGLISANIFHILTDKNKSLISIIKKNIKAITLFLLILFLGIILINFWSELNVDKKIFQSFFEIFRKIIETISIVAIPLLIVLFIGYGAIKKVKVYEQFVEGAKEGFNIAVRIIPYLVAMLVAISIFRSGGAMDKWLIPVLSNFTDLIGMPAEALPMALMRPLSGSGSLGIMAEIMSIHGPDSFIGILVSTFYGSTETTFYVLAVYFGAVNVKNTRYALPVGLIADVVGILSALFIVSKLYG